jgi:hypothetical protein
MEPALFISLEIIVKCISIFTYLGKQKAKSQNHGLRCCKTYTMRKQLLLKSSFWLAIWLGFYFLAT